MKDIIQKWFIENNTDLIMEMTEVFHGYGNGIIDNPWHLEGSIWEHTKMVMNQVQRHFEGDYILMISALLHDIGKVKTYEDFRDKSGTYKRSFKNHEAISVFMASDILNSTNIFDLRDFEKEQILKIIGLHGRLYDFIAKEEKIQDVAKMFENDPCTLEYLRKFYICDHSGRIVDPKLKKSTSEEVNKWFKDVLEFITMQKYDENKTLPGKTITVLVGLPRAGKSTYCKTLKDVVVISRDNILMEYAEEDETYSEVWKRLQDTDQKNIDKELQSRFNKAVKSGDNIVIDMTNTSKKSRRKWLANAKGYHKKCVVFPTGIKTCNSRNTSDKNIPKKVLESMSKRFVVPLYDEFNKISWNI